MIGCHFSLYELNLTQKHYLKETKYDNMDNVTLKVYRTLKMNQQFLEVWYVKLMMCLI